MTKFIELTTEDDDELLVNVEAIHYVYPTIDRKETFISFGSNTFLVKENYETVATRIGRATLAGTTEGIIER